MIIKLLRKKNIFFTCVALCIFSICVLNKKNSSNSLHLKINFEIEATGWPHNSSKSISDYIKFDKNSTLIIPNSFCTTDQKLLIMFVITAPERFIQRQTIRDSWGDLDNFNYDKFKHLHAKAHGKYLEINTENWENYIYNKDDLTENTPFDAKFRIQLVFLMGHSRDSNVNMLVKRESNQFEDILMEDFIDHYANMTLKSVAMLKWGTAICKKNSKFIAKIDDDEFVNLPNLIHVLLGGTLPLYADLKYFYDYNTIKIMEDENRSPHRNLLTGYKWNFGFPIRDPNDKYYTPHYLYNQKWFPSYLGGFIYVMSSDVASKLLEGVFSVPLFHLEDIYITGLIANYKNIASRKNHLIAFKPVNNLCMIKGLLAEQGRDFQQRGQLMKYLFSPAAKDCEILDTSYSKYLYKFLFMFEPWLSFIGEFIYV
uniref:Hexosyltransferase n=1 Tax=Culicoides sonorensis TaxID=179676 RepID=A0A336LUZ1_CULSO